MENLKSLKNTELTKKVSMLSARLNKEFEGLEHTLAHESNHQLLAAAVNKADLLLEVDEVAELYHSELLGIKRNYNRNALKEKLEAAELKLNQ